MASGDVAGHHVLHVKVPGTIHTRRPSLQRNRGAGTIDLLFSTPQ